jgi:Secretion system C-terminal sorting domain
MISRYIANFCKCISIVVTLTFVALLANGQKQLGNEWYMGSPHYRISFVGDTAYANRLNPLDSFFPRAISSIANICSADGFFKFGTNNLQIINPNGLASDSGNYLIPDTSRLTLNLYLFGNNSIILPKGNNTFYVFTCTQSNEMAYGTYYHSIDTFDFDQILYAVVDMNANGGKGAIIENKKVLLQAKSPWISKTNFTCTRHANGRDWWLVKPSARNRTIKYMFLVQPDTIIASTIIVDSTFDYLTYDNVGQSCFSADGSLYAECNKGSPHSIYRFDRCAGTMQLLRQLDMRPYSKYRSIRYDGVAFSPNGKFLYTSDGLYIYQIDLAEPNDASAVQCVSEADSIDWPIYYNTMQITPTGQLHMGSWGGVSGYQNAIMRPNEKGVACTFKINYLVSSYWYVPWDLAPFNDPPNMPFFELGALANSPCDTLGPKPPPPPSSPYNNWVVYPSASTDEINIQVPNNSATVGVQLYNALGQMLFNNAVQVQANYVASFSVKHLASGMYFVHINSATKPFTTKIIKR